MKAVGIPALAAIFGIGLFAVVSSAAWATTVTVGVGRDYDTIQGGVNAGDVVEVYPGYYDESVTIDNKTVTITAVNGPLLTKVIGSGDGFTVTKTGNATIQGFSITKGANAVAFSGTCTVYNCILTGIGGAGYSRVDSGARGSIANCLVMGCGGSGIQSTWSLPQPVIGVKNCIIEFNNGYGIQESTVSRSESNIGSSYNCYFQNQNGHRYIADKGPGDLDDTNPFFRDADHFDFRLSDSPASTCIDAGDPAPGMQDPDGTRSDIGLYGGPYCASFWYGPLNAPAVRGVVANPPVVQYGDTFRIEGTAEIR